MQHLISPLTGLAGLWGSFQSSASAVERISNVLDIQPINKELPTYVDSVKIPKTIQFSHISFSYDQETQILIH